MRALYFPFWTLFLVICTACAALGLETPATFDQRAYAAEATVVQVRKSAAVLLNAKKIDVEDAENALKQTDLAAQGIKIARALPDPTQKENRLTAIVAILTAIQTYLAAKGK